MSKTNKLRTLKYVISNALPFRKYFLLHIFVVLFHAVDTSLWPYVSKLLIDSIAQTPKEQVWENSKYLVMLFIFLTVLPGLVWRITDYAWSCLIPLMRQKIVVDSSQAMIRKSHDFFYNNSSGYLTNRVKDLSQNTTRLLDIILYQFLTIFLSLIVAFYTLWIHAHQVFAIGLIVWSLVFIYMAVKALELTAKMSDDVTSSHAKAIGNIVDVFSNIQNVKFFTNEDAEIKRIHNNFSQYAKFFKVRGFFLVKFYTLHGLLFSVYFSLAVFTLIYYYSKGVITLGDFVLTFTINSWMINSMWRMAGQLQKFAEDYGAVDQSLRIIERPLKVKDKKRARKLKVKRKNGPEIVIDNIEFSYHDGSGKGPAKQKVIKKDTKDEKEIDLIKVSSDLSVKGKLVIPSGQRVGLVGSSGSGKSTFVNLLMRSYDVGKGKILIDGQDIKNVTQKSLRESISFVPQEPILFHRSIYNNIRYAKLEASNEEIEAALKDAYCHRFIKRLPQGYDTIVGDRGSRISGGQKQRLSIARAFLEDSKILIMDESTSNLDSVTEQLVHRGLVKLMKKKTVIIVAHKLMTLQELDRILVFKHGKIVEDGSHDELIKIKDGHYKTMWEKQTVELLDMEK